MIEGITVLSESANNAPWWLILLDSMLAAFLCFLIYLFSHSDMRYGALTSVIVLIVVFSVGSFLNAMATTTYKVLIDDSVSMKDFDELYEIVGHDGDTVIIKLKEHK